jgi:hypothetical protein
VTRKHTGRVLVANIVYSLHCSDLCCGTSVKLHHDSTPNCASSTCTLWGGGFPATGHVNCDTLPHTPIHNSSSFPVLLPHLVQKMMLPRVSLFNRLRSTSVHATSGTWVTQVAPHQVTPSDTDHNNTKRSCCRK